MNYQQESVVTNCLDKIGASLISSVLFLVFNLLAAPALAQNTGATPRYGEVDLAAGFIDDPHMIGVQAGGLDEVPDLDGVCSGYIFTDSPDYNINYSSGTETLSIIVLSDEDTTLLINDADGRWHCNDDSIFAGGSNPAISFTKPTTGTFNIWVGTYGGSGDYPEVNLFITELESDLWANFDSNSSTNNSIGNVQFGDDASTWSNDGECDDPRFEGDGMAASLVPEDVLHDASDCATLFANGSITLIEPASTIIDFGDDSSAWANDGECDDPRFEGGGVAGTLLDEDLGHDASDCRALFDSGDITLASGLAGSINFGDDSSSWANDGECDDPRFEGNGMASIPLTEDEFRDATDCRTLFESGQITLVLNYVGDIDFGDNSSSWANDGECDDPRFEGTGMASSPLEEDEFRDATDCRTLFDAGSIQLADQLISALDLMFGDDNGSWPRDGECDDPRFEGNGVADFADDADRFHDATDCRTLFDTGQITLVNNDTIELQRTGQTINGSLSSADLTRGNDAYIDKYSLTGRAGDEFVVDLSSSEFDTYLIVTTPNGEEFTNDDYQGNTERSRLRLIMEESGTVTLVVTSFSAGELGSYKLGVK